jgi:signal transduction histidine kinase
MYPALTTILDRLTDNALKFTLAGGEIEVRARPKREGGLTIEISDTGVGMTDAEIVDALTPFGQADSTLSRLYEGAGLGLTLASALTRSMGADFTVESEPEKGTLIRMHFPDGGVSARSRTENEPDTEMWVSG